MSNIVEFKYLSNNIQFEVINGRVMANATTMFKNTESRLDHWKASEQTKRYVEAVTRKLGIAENQLIITKRGGTQRQGTWIHEKLILNAARYISIDFELWCDDKIAELLREGLVSMKPKPAKVAALSKHTDRVTQIENSKSINSFYYDRGGRDKIKEYNQKNCYEHTGKFPNELMEIAKREGIPSKYRTSGKEVVRYYKPHVAASMSLTDELCRKGGMDVREAASLAKKSQQLFAKMIEFGMLEE